MAIGTARNLPGHTCSSNAGVVDVLRRMSPAHPADRLPLSATRGPLTAALLLSSLNSSHMATLIVLPGKTQRVCVWTPHPL